MKTMIIMSDEDFGKVKESGVIDTDSGHDLIPRLQKNSSRRAPLLRWMRIKTERFVRISSLFPQHFFFIPSAFLLNSRCISFSQVTLEEFTAAILAREQFSKMLTLKIIDIFVEDE